MNRVVFWLPFLAAVSASAAVISVPLENGPTSVSSRFLSFDGRFIPDSSTVRIGFFVGAPVFNCNNAYGSSPSALQNFVGLGEPASPAGYGTPGGNTLHVSGGVISGAINDLTFGTGTPDTIVSGFLARGTKLYLLVNVGIQWGAFSASTWLVPTNPGSFGGLMRTSQLDAWPEVYWGQLLNVNPTVGNQLVVGALCPEPTGTGCSLLVGSFFGFRRRRRSYRR